MRITKKLKKAEKDGGSGRGRNEGGDEREFSGEMKREEPHFHCVTCGFWLVVDVNECAHSLEGRITGA